MFRIWTKEPHSFQFCLHRAYQSKTHRSRTQRMKKKHGNVKGWWDIYSLCNSNSTAAVLDTAESQQRTVPRINQGSSALCLPSPALGVLGWWRWETSSFLPMKSHPEGRGRSAHTSWHGKSLGVDQMVWAESNLTVPLWATVSSSVTRSNAVHHSELYKHLRS